MNRFLIGVAILALSICLLIRAFLDGLYGWTLFVIFPVFLGGLAAWVFRPSTALRALGLGFLTMLIGLGSLLATGKEGLLCLLMHAPLAIPLGTFGSWFVYRATHAKPRRESAALAMLPLATLGWDVTAKPPVFEVRTQLTIAATPEQVWKHVVTFSELAEPDEWFLRAGLAYPKRARIDGSGVGAVRYCEFSTGPFVEPIEVWDEPRLLQFRVTENPAPMHEWSPYHEVLPKHLHGYLVSKKGQFRLTRLSNGGTLLEGTTWYQHGLWPAQYWRLWSDAIIHRIHLRVLEHVKNLSEASAKPVVGYNQNHGPRPRYYR